MDNGKDKPRDRAWVAVPWVLAFVIGVVLLFVNPPAAGFVFRLASALSKFL